MEQEVRSATWLCMRGSRTGVGWTRLDCEEAGGLLYRIVLYYTGDMHNAVQHSTVQYSAAQYSTVTRVCRQ